MILTENELRMIIKRAIISEEISMDAPLGDAIKNGLENINVAGLDIDDFQLGLDVIGIGADVISGLAAAGSLGPQAIAGVPISGVAGAVSIAADVTNASLYAARGEWYDAILSTIAIVPIGGSVIKVVGKVGKPLVKHMIVPIIKAASDGAKVDPKFIQNLIMSMDPSTLAKMEPGALVDFQKQINKHSNNIGGLISGIEKGDAKAFNKVLPDGKKIPDFAKDVFQGTMTKAVQNNPEISGYLRFLKGITGFFADPSIAKYTDDMATARKAVESGADPNALKAFAKKYEGQTPFDLAKTGKLTAQQRSAAFKKMLTKGGRNRRFMWGVVERYGEDSPEADKVLEIMQLMEDHGEDSTEVKNALSGMVKETPAIKKLDGYKEAAQLFMNLEENKTTRSIISESRWQKLAGII